MNGQSAWVYDGSQTKEIGLFDGANTSLNGVSYNEAVAINDVGMVLGTADRFSGNTSDKGHSAWLYNGTSTVRLGLTSGEFTKADGTQESVGQVVNNLGQVAGNSTAYIGANTYSRTWLYNGTSTVAIGLNDSTNPFSQSLSRLNQAGHAIGHTFRTDGDFRQSAWLYNGSSTIDIGLHGSEHVRADGYFSSTASMLNQAGQVVGTAKRFNGASDLGKSAWIHSGGSTSEIGLLDNAHTRSDGYRTNSPVALNENGQVIGNAKRYDGNVDKGQSAWLYSGGNSSEIGLVDSAHTSADGARNSTAVVLNNAGKAAGTSVRYDSPGQKTSAWAFNGNESVEIGVLGEDANTVQKINEAGQVIGSALKTDQAVWGSEVREIAWLYDMSLNQTFDLTLSTRSDGFSSSHAGYLGEDGTVLGSYTVFGDDDASLGTHLFYFSEKVGMWDLGALLSAMDQSDWTSLGSSIQASGIDKFVGVGLFQGHSAAYLMTANAPTVPLPASAWLFGSSVLGIFGIKRKFRVTH
jgi:hypothetical protein